MKGKHSKESKKGIKCEDVHGVCLAQDGAQWQARVKINCTAFEIAVPSFLHCIAPIYRHSKAEVPLQTNKQTDPEIHIDTLNADACHGTKSSENIITLRI
jgi:hypothetical protein